MLCFRYVHDSFLPNCPNERRPFFKTLQIERLAATRDEINISHAETVWPRWKWRNDNPAGGWVAINTDINYLIWRAAFEKGGFCTFRGWKSLVSLRTPVKYAHFQLLWGKLLCSNGSEMNFTNMAGCKKTQLDTTITLSMSFFGADSVTTGLRYTKTNSTVPLFCVIPLKKASFLS